MRMVDGYFVDDLLLFTEGGGFVSRGFEIRLPGGQSAGVGELNQQEDELRLLLRSLPKGSRAQLRWTVDSDYRQALLDYYEDTENLRCSEAVVRIRNEKFVACWEAMESRELRRERLHLFVTLPAEAGAREGGKGPAGRYSALLDAGGRAIEEISSGIVPIVGRMGGGVKPLDDPGHFEECLRFYNPSMVGRRDSVTEELFDPLESIQENCFLSDPAPTTAPCGFFMDGHWHGLLVLATLPNATHSGMMRQLTGLGLRDYEITVNIRPLDVGEEINRAESEAKKLENALNANPRAQMRSAMEVKLDRLRRLISNEVMPFKFQFVIRAWAETSNELNTKLATLRSAVTKLGGSKVYDAAFPVTARNVFGITHPGWCWDRYEDHSIYLEDHHLANMLPFSGSQEGDLAGAEAIYEGSNRNLVGISTFSGIEGNRWPKHAIFTGKTGSGKSTLLADVLAQTSPFYDFTAIVDHGGSHLELARSLDENVEPIIIRPNGDVTFNYLDTQSLPMSAQHLSDATAVVELMIGTGGNEERDRLRSALISKSLDEFYRDHYRQLCADSEQLRRFAACVSVVLTFDRFEPEGSITDRFVALKRLWDDDPQAYRNLLDSVGGDEVEDFLADTSNEEAIYKLVFTRIDREQYPTHSQFQEWLWLESMGDRDDSEELGKLATLLHPWRADQGRYGSLLDGVGTVSFSGSLVYFELGQIPESAAELKPVVALLITNFLQNEIASRPDDQRNRVIIEEMCGFFSIPSGAEIVSGLFERARKKKCWVVGVIQQGQSLDGSGAGASIYGNSRIAFLLKQTEQSEIDRLGEIFSLPESVTRRLAAFPEASESGGAPFLAVNGGDDGMEVFEGINRTSLVQPSRTCGTTAGANESDDNRDEKVHD